MKLFMISLGLVSLLLAQGSGNSSNCHVNLRVVDYEGRPAPYEVVSFRDHLGHEYSSRFASLAGQVPCHVTPYVYQVHRLGVDHRLAFIEGQIGVSHPETWLTIVTSPNIVFGATEVLGSLSRITPPGYILRGMILSPAPTDRLWVSIRSAVSSDRVEAGVDPDGSFRIYSGLFNGPYTLAVMNEAGDIVYLAALKVTAFAAREPLIIDLSAGRAPSLVVK